jgi:hypothetical protein
MTGKMTWLAVILLLFGSSMAVAQTPTAQQGNDDRPASDPAASSSADPRQKETLTAMYEDIEIMRRLLSSQLERLYPSRARDRRQWDEFRHLGDLSGFQPSRSELFYPGLVNQYFSQKRHDDWLQNGAPLDNTSAANQQYWVPDPITGTDRDALKNVWGVLGPRLRVFDVEGSYLPGYGIVYTVTLPPPLRKAKSESTKPQPKPLSDWDRVRKQLHGEEQPDKGQPAPAQPREPSLTDVILKTLYENGHHLTRLNNNEGLTVAITFRPMEPQGIQVTFADPVGSPAASGTSSVGGGNAGATSSSSDSSAIGGTSGSAAKKPPSSARDYLLLGDLDLRRGQPMEALNDYRRALNQMSPKADDNHTLSQLLELYRKLDQERLSLTDLENVRKEIDLLEKLDERQAPKRTGPAQPVEARLPGKLLISAPKGLLDQAGAGKIGFEQFKKVVTVEELEFAKSNATAGGRSNY